MYYELKVINGVLHMRYDPDAEFKILSAESITDHYMAARDDIKELKAENERLREALLDYLNSGIMNKTVKIFLRKDVQGLSENSTRYANISSKCLCLQCPNDRAKKALQGKEGEI